MDSILNTPPPIRRKTTISSPTTPKGQAQESISFPRPSRKQSASLPLNHLRKCVISEEASMNWREKHKVTLKKNEEVINMTSYSIGPCQANEETSELKLLDRLTLIKMLKAFIKQHELEGIVDEVQFFKRFMEQYKEVSLFFIETKFDFDLSVGRFDEIVFIEKGGVIKIHFNEKTLLGENTSFSIDCWDKDTAYCALENSKLWIIERSLLTQFIQLFTVMQLESLMPLVKAIPFFKALATSQLEEICLNLRPYDSDAFALLGAVWVPDSKESRGIYIISQGSIYTTSRYSEDENLKAPGVIGDNDFFLRWSSLTVKITEAPVKMFFLSQEKIKQLFGHSIKTIVSKRLIIESLIMSKSHNYLSPMELNRLALECEAKTYKQDEEIDLTNSTSSINETSPLSASCSSSLSLILLSGEVQTPEGCIISKVGTLLQNDNTFKRSASEWDKEGRKSRLRVITPKVMVAELAPQMISSFTMIDSLIFESKEELYPEETESKSTKSPTNFSPTALEKKKIILNSKEISTCDLEPVSFLGEGRYGQVVLVKYKGINYALKFTTKEHIISHKLEKYTQNERNCLAEIESPFIMSLFATLQDHNNIYLLTEYIRGEELFDLIRKPDYECLSVDHSRFYLACLIMAVKHLHDRNIIHRDIKPGNIIINRRGYLKIIDLGIAKRLEPESLRTYSIIGTPHYMAPEVFKGNGYSTFCDYWALGVCLFEFLNGFLPFGIQELDDPLEIFKTITNTKLTFDKHVTDRAAKKLTKQLLRVNPEARLDGTGDIHTLMNHQWFKDFKWDKFERMDLKAPYIPSEEIMQSKEIIQVEGVNFEEFLNNYVLKSEGQNVSNFQLESEYKDWDVTF